MASYFWEGLAGPIEKQVEKGLDARRDRIKRQQQRDEAVTFIKGLEEAGIGIDQLSSVNPESGTVGLKQPMDMTSILTLLGSGNIGGGSMRGQSGAGIEQSLPQPETEVPQGTGFESLPIINRLFGLGRDVGRTIGMRETQRGLVDSLKARATPALKAAGEVGVLTDQDVQRMLGGGFAGDADTVESRWAKRQGNRATFAEKEKALLSILDKPLTPQLQSFGGRSGARFAIDPAQVASRKKAQEQLDQLRQISNLMEQIYDEADRLMPAIGAGQNAQGQSSQTPQASGGGFKVIRRK